MPYAHAYMAPDLFPLFDGNHYLSSDDTMDARNVVIREIISRI